MASTSIRVALQSVDLERDLCRFFVATVELPDIACSRAAARDGSLDGGQRCLAHGLRALTQVWLL